METRGEVPYLERWRKNRIKCRCVWLFGAL